MDLQILTIPPQTEHSHTVVFLHGRNSRGILFVDMFQGALTSQLQSLPDSFPSFRWVFPQSEILSIASSHPEPRARLFCAGNIRDSGNRERPEADWLRQSVAGIRRVAKREAELLDGRWERVILAGIGQGGSTVVHALLNLDLVDLVPGAPSPSPASNKRLGALVVFSSRMPFSRTTVAETREVLGLGDVPDGDEVVRNTPVLLEHCIDDPVALIGWGRQLRDLLTGFGCRIAWKEYPEGGNWLNSPMGMDDVVTFLNQALGLGAAPGSTKL